VLSAKTVEQYITQHLPCEFIEVQGEDGTHFQAVIVSAEFEGKTMVQQHQRVYAALGDKMHSEIHALSMKTMTPQQWQNNQ
jgi:acid stress-induced BolA-like protein IbaG/YrbA